MLRCQPGFAMQTPVSRGMAWGWYLCELLTQAVEGHDLPAENQPAIRSAAPIQYHGDDCTAGADHVFSPSVPDCVPPGGTIVSEVFSVSTVTEVDWSPSRSNNVCWIRLPSGSTSSFSAKAVLRWCSLLCRVPSRQYMGHGIGFDPDRWPEALRDLFLLLVHDYLANHAHTLRVRLFTKLTPIIRVVSSTAVIRDSSGLVR